MLKYIIKNAAFVISNIEYPCGKFSVTKEQPILLHKNRCHIASLILSMSKRIMNEVMCTAEDNGIMIYYQDTDSILIEHNDINRLKVLFNEKYGRDLIGNELGQFHSDFAISRAKLPRGVCPLSTYSVVLGKKAHAHYITATTETGEPVSSNHLRLKGVTNAALIKRANELYDEFYYNSDEIYTKAREKNPPTPELWLYTLLYFGASIRFDLTAGGKPAIRIRRFANNSLLSAHRQICFRKKK
jgi:hypothetical protein